MVDMPLELQLNVTKFLGITSIVHLASSCRVLHHNLKREIWRRMILWHKTLFAPDLRYEFGEYEGMLYDYRSPYFLPNPIVHAMDLRMPFESIKEVVEQCRKIYCPLINGYNIGDETNWPPIFVAVDLQRPDLMNLLEENGADMNIRQDIIFCPRRRRHRYPLIDLTVKKPSDFYCSLTHLPSHENWPFGMGILEVALQCRDLTMVRTILSRTDIIICSGAFDIAIANLWLLGIAAILDSRRLSPRTASIQLMRAIGRVFSHPDYPEFRDYDIADFMDGLADMVAERDMDIRDVTLLSSLIEGEYPLALLKLLQRLQYSHSTLKDVLKSSVRKDRFLPVTIQIVKSEEFTNAEWNVVLGKAFRRALRSRRKPENEDTLRFLLRQTCRALRVEAAASKTRSSTDIKNLMIDKLMQAIPTTDNIDRLRIDGCLCIDEDNRLVRWDWRRDEFLNDHRTLMALARAKNANSEESSWCCVM
ncbi:hypothetical protein F5Y18DRAFT_431772 [Xylariaceae sp. FL1019]|nr:hypothetical protein F5Y18DRAFT_431772 [Xylariaceae sp. FL1019]